MGSRAPGTKLREGADRRRRIDGAGGVVRRHQDERPRAFVDQSLGLTDVRPAGGHVSARLGQVEVAKIVPALVDAYVPVLGFAVVRPTLEDVFVSLTGEGFDVSG